MSHEFCENLPAACPPVDAVPVQGDVYRGCRTADLSDQDFLSFGELRSARHDPSLCAVWGLSVWVSQEAVEFARANMPYVRKWHIHRGNLSPEHGVIIATPSAQQPEHHTFWKDRNQSVAALFELYLEPEAA